MYYNTCVLQALVQPLKFFGGKRRVWRYVLASWLLAALVAVPQLMVFVQTEERRHSSVNATPQHNVTTVYKCSSAGYTAEWQRKLYVTFVTISRYRKPTQPGHPSWVGASCT